MATRELTIQPTRENKSRVVDAVSTIPNIALMKLNACYKPVDIVRCGISYYTNRYKDVIVDAAGYDKVFVSAVFFPTPDQLKVTNCGDIEYGGSAYSITKSIPDEIAKLKSDYSIYPDADTSYGFITRGCFRNCPFCIVRQKEGNIHLDEPIVNIAQHDKVKFLDNNILGHPQVEQILQELADRKLRCQFNQGLDVRILTDRKAELLSKIRCNEYIFAFDQLSDEKLVTEKFNLFKKYVCSENHYDSSFFIYCHPDMDILDDVLYRVKWCRENYALPYLMLDIACWESPDIEFYLDLKSWCNWRQNWISIPFEKFIENKCFSNKIRQQRSIATYNEGKQNPAKWLKKIAAKNMQVVLDAEQLTTDDFEDLII